MDSDLNILELVQRGGVLSDIAGNCTDVIYRNICDNISIPPYIDREVLYQELCNREKLISTAIGNGVSIPHTSHPLIKSISDQQITVCYLKTPANLNAADKMPVKTMFVILAHDQQTHLKMLSQLAFLFQNEKFKQALNMRPDFVKLQQILREIL